MERVAAVLQDGGGWTSAANFPRAHYPFPTRGRWAPGEMALPSARKQGEQRSDTTETSTRHDLMIIALQSMFLAEHSPLMCAGFGRTCNVMAMCPFSHPWRFAQSCLRFNNIGISEDLFASDCWALGEDFAWQGNAASGSTSAPLTDAGEARRLLRRAFCDGDIVLNLNSPPRWPPPGGSPPFAATRPGVLWPCYQVEAGFETPAQSSVAPGCVHPGTMNLSSAPYSNAVGAHSGVPAVGSSSSSGSARSWQATETDLFGRSLPRQELTASMPTTGAFVSQDNTAVTFEGRRLEDDALSQQVRLAASYHTGPGYRLAIDVSIGHRTAGWR